MSILILLHQVYDASTPHAFAIQHLSPVKPNGILTMRELSMCCFLLLCTESAILITDGVRQVLAVNHKLRATGGAYTLLEGAKLPFDCCFDDVYGPVSVSGHQSCSHVWNHVHKRQLAAMDHKNVSVMLNTMNHTSMSAPQVPSKYLKGINQHSASPPGS